MDCIIMDATNVFSTTSQNHLDKAGIESMMRRMKADGVIDKDTCLYATHFSHTGYKSIGELMTLEELFNMKCAVDMIASAHL